MIKLNNKGFAITTILFGVLVLFLLLLISLLGILSTYRKNLNKLIGDIDGADNGKGARAIVTVQRKCVSSVDVVYANMQFNAGLYCFSPSYGSTYEGSSNCTSGATKTCRYIGTTELNTHRGIDLG